MSIEHEDCDVMLCKMFVDAAVINPIALRLWSNLLGGSEE
ncbi:hypothetical protein STSP2_03013 [Anaerohalosphaera lusitana]|uniref:Uncharacterized protein n=1 Tax=Anaerohalosphaera lusitana TaxID=1936003 RepID=A0A1U9NQM8_9BACT|nr:hypothetical protein STSP2_03013 [Anaerohalosphaera lusitana]